MSYTESRGEHNTVIVQKYAGRYRIVNKKLDENFGYQEIFAENVDVLMDMKHAISEMLILELQNQTTENNQPRLKVVHDSEK